MSTLSVQEQLRAAIKPQTCIDKLNGIDSILSDEWRSLGKNQIESLRLRADINLRLLAKELADRKATEIVGDTSSPVQFLFQVNRKDPQFDETKQAA
jgi:hypothetical protein